MTVNLGSQVAMKRIIDLRDLITRDESSSLVNVYIFLKNGIIVCIINLKELRNNGVRKY